MNRRTRRILGVAGAVFAVLGIASTVLALTDDVRWRFVQTPLIVAAAACAVTALLGGVIAPAKELWRLGYDAGLRDGARAMMSDSVTELVPRQQDVQRLN